MPASTEELVRTVRSSDLPDNHVARAALALCRLSKPESVTTLVKMCFPDGISAPTFDIVSDAYARWRNA